MTANPFAIASITVEPVFGSAGGRGSDGRAQETGEPPRGEGLARGLQGMSRFGHLARLSSDR